MSAEIIRFPGVTRLDGQPDPIMTEALGKLDRVVIIGYDTEGEEYFASSIADGGEVLWLMERMKLLLLRYADKE